MVGRNVVDCNGDLGWIPARAGAQLRPAGVPDVSNQELPAVTNIDDCSKRTFTFGLHDHVQPQHPAGGRWYPHLAPGRCAAAEDTREDVSGPGQNQSEHTK